LLNKSIGGISSQEK